MRRCRDKRAIESCCEEITHGVAQLEETRQEAAGIIRQVFERSSRCWPKQSTHSDSIECTNRQELTQILAETGSQLEDDEKNQVSDHRPLPTIAVADYAEDERADRAKHQSDGQALEESQLPASPRARLLPKSRPYRSRQIPQRSP